MDEQSYPQTQIAVAVDAGGRVVDAAGEDDGDMAVAVGTDVDIGDGGGVDEVEEM